MSWGILRMHAGTEGREAQTHSLQVDEESFCIQACKHNTTGQLIFFLYRKFMIQTFKRGRGSIIAFMHGLVLSGPVHWKLPG